jgi:hypothetical protein
MKEENEWVFYQEIDWNDSNFNIFNVDTRDFHCGYTFRDTLHKDFETLKKYPHFFYTEVELKALLNRYFTESGGKKKWRLLSLEGVEDSKGWRLKYLRICKTSLGFIVCDSYYKALSKEYLNHPVDTEYLGAY